MSEWAVALIAAGAALAGSVVTGWYGRSAGIRQAEAARHAGERQADALLASVRLTLSGEARLRAQELRRRTYTEFLAAADDRLLAERTGRGQGGDEAALHRAAGAVELEGPDEVAGAARALVAALRRHASPDDLRDAKRQFTEAARTALATAAP
ncbi:hypothetical protein [Streptomyces sp. NPDC050145]|uniref:hypothetical protein n=1 Tax=Streptomyces sp. NPDC050145 TaxID=3365602 RepID=UPI00378F0B7B